MDTGFPEEKDLQSKREGDRLYGPAIGDNALGRLAGLLAVARKVAARPLAGEVWVISTIGKEGLGNLLGMREIVKRLGGRVTGYLALEGSALGRIGVKGIGARRIRIRVEGPAGHAWSHRGRPSLIHGLAEIAAEVVRLRLPRQPPASINIGTVRGGIGINAIAPEAKMTVDLRCENAETLDRLEARLREIRSTHQGKGFRISLDLIGERPAGAIAPLHPLVRAAGRTGAGHELGAGSTDANVPLGLGLPSLCVGPSKGGEAPTPQEFIERPPRKPRLRFLFLLLREAFSGPP